VSSFLIANLYQPNLPSPPPGQWRRIGACSRCDRQVTWMRSFDCSGDARPVVCGFCARQPASERIERR
jgi:hypothetical protein